MAIFVIAVLLASAQCVWACTLATCGDAQPADTPPCHEHNTPAPAQHSTHDQACDHQKAADHVRPAMPDLQVVADVPAGPSPMAMFVRPLETAPVMFRPPPLLEAPASVLRI